MKMRSVSIPHRYSKDKGGKKMIEETLLVSIPHRYSKDVEDWIRNIACLTEFQSLIGILKTIICIDEINDRSMFQSLIGILKTRPSSSFRSEPISKVSIPHRYSKDSSHMPYPHLMSNVSIPHRYSKDRIQTKCLL